MNIRVDFVHSVDCKACGHTAKGRSQKEMWFWMTLHLKFCHKSEKKIRLFKTLWQLWRWVP